MTEIVPSSARSTASSAIPLPTHLVPLLSSPLDRLKEAVDNVLPRHKDRTALEEAMFEEDEGGLAGAEILQSEYQFLSFNLFSTLQGGSLRCCRSGDQGGNVGLW